MGSLLTQPCLRSKYDDASNAKFYRGGVKIHEMKGANKAGLETVVKVEIRADRQKLAEASGEASGEASAAVPAGTAVQLTRAAKSPVPGQVDLQSFIQSNQIECLNSDAAHPVQNIFKPDASVLQSDVDEQLIVSFSFNQPVKNGPKTVKTFVNRTSTLSFEDAESEPSVDCIELKPADLAADSGPVPLRFVKYQYVHHLTVRIGL
ncbi:Thioredoxin-like protein 1 [Kappamyces sp. JEL0680]|nr:Thioredoxin-like protein 1 [Kappamyces sp. JEL0680]